MTPAAYLSTYSGSINIWMWGLLSITIYGYGSRTDFTQDPNELSLSLISSLLVLICIIAIISSSALSRKNMRAGVTKKNPWLPLSILVIIGTIIWMAGMEILSLSYSIPFSFWGQVNPGFGVIGMFLGASLSIIGYGVSKLGSRQPREVIIPMKKQFMSPEQAYTAPSPVATDLTQSSFKFCPMCGYKMMKADQRYCVNCGEQFESVALETE